ncbi:WD domain, G-beta repeat protein (macronuclear) [Tetrahymena thermophila SB210]|uniref:WD domain, G-beta repeat protein n=1 Tax=Tetrahymena thermophila (strain SB210) TaxID=312017 RepID=I7MEY7_TETTS|nr:WD domain, G-beta repeat protein [Tetrahymena thermophila SB210]EAR98147.1 WD domain, G-beta repeat protein [Tetrahymena thermophila SB210]|eukprot:XP_001018392.1 WD domain, G-beta repeat protein [Tetrahymena thermophila SB210]
MKVQTRFNKKYSQIFELNKERLLGGGVACSKGVVNSNKHIVEKQSKQESVSQVSQEFLNVFQQILNQKHLADVINCSKQDTEIAFIFEKIFIDLNTQILADIENYRVFIIEILNILLKYVIMIIQNSSSKQTDFDELDKKFNQLKQQIQVISTDRSCTDIISLIQFIQMFIQQRIRLDDINQQQQIKIQQFVGEVVKWNYKVKNQQQSSNINLVSQLRSIVDGGISLYDSIKTITDVGPERNAQPQDERKISDSFRLVMTSQITKMEQNLLRIWFKMIELFDKKKEIKFEDQIEFYIDRFIELKQQADVNELILYILTQINFYFECGFHEQEIKYKFNFNAALEKKIPITNSKMREFINILQFQPKQKNISEQEQKFFIFSQTDPTFRFLISQILMKYRVVAEKVKEKKEAEKYQNHLFYLYVTERNPLVQVSFFNSDSFKEYASRYLKENQMISRRMIEIQDQRKSDLIQFGVHLNTYKSLEEQIEDENSFQEIFELKQIEQLQVELRQKYFKNMVHNNELLFEIKELYIDQSFQFLFGKQLFFMEGDLSAQKQNPKEQDQVFQKIVNCFLKQQKISNQKINDNTLIKNHILAIVGEGGTGKTMLLKKIENKLIQQMNQQNGDLNCDYIPIFVSFSQLDFQKPSLESYLISQGMGNSLIQIIKASKKYKVLLLDGFDQYQGQFFRIYQQLNLNQWKNLLIIVTCRNDQLQEKDFTKYFSIDCEYGGIDRDLFTCIELKKLNRKQIIDYCQVYYQLNCNSDVQSQQLLKYTQDIIHSNRFIEKQIKNPGNLFLFARLVELLEDKNQIEEIKQLKSKNILIEELFFQKLFLREAKKIYKDIGICQYSELIIQMIKSSFFEYYQSISIKMLTNKGKVLNYLQGNKLLIDYYLSEDLQELLTVEQQEEVYQKICGYFNPDIMTNLNNTLCQIKSKNTYSNDFKRVAIQQEKNANQTTAIAGLNNQQMQLAQTMNGQSSFAVSKASSFEVSQLALQKNPVLYNQLTQLESAIEFRTKHLFEYFAARAMRYDFDCNIEKTYLLGAEKICKFGINQQLLYRPTDYRSEKQILIKFFKLIKNFIDSSKFLDSYCQDEALQQNRYIQFIKRAKTLKKSMHSQLDIGSSNLLTAIFMSNFQFPFLDLTYCSFTKVYIPERKNRNINFNKSNLNQAYLLGSNLNFEGASTTGALFNLFQEEYNLRDTLTFLEIDWSEDNQFFSISQTGCMNCFKFRENGIQLMKSNKVGIMNYNKCQRQNDIFNFTQDNFLFQVSEKYLDIIKTHKFEFKIKAISQSYDNKILAILENNDLYLGDIYEGFGKLKNLSGYPAYISQNGFQFIMANQGSQELQLFDILNVYNDIKQSEIFNLPSKLISSINTKNNRYIVFNLEDNQSQIRSANNKFKLIQTFPRHILQIESSDNSEKIAFIQEKSQCQIFSLELGSFVLIKTIELNTVDILYSMSFSLDNKYFSIALNQSVLKVFNLNENVKLQFSKEENKSINQIGFSKDVTHLATLSKNNSCLFYKIDENDPNEFQQVWKLSQMNDQVEKIAFCQANQKFVISYSNGMIGLYVIQDQIEFHSTVEAHFQSIEQMVFSHDGKYLAVSFGNTLKLFDVSKKIQFHSEIDIQDESKEVRITSIDFSYCNRYLAVAFDNNSFNIYTFINKKPLEFKQNFVIQQANSITQILFSSDGKYILTSCQNFCFIWDFDQNIQLFQKLQIEKDIKINQMLISYDSNYLITLTSDNVCTVWNIFEQFRVIKEIFNQTQVNYISISSDSKYLAFAYNDGFFKILRTGLEYYEAQSLIKTQKQKVLVSAFSTDGKYLATGSSDSKCKIWLVQKGFEYYLTLKGHLDSISSLAFSNNNEFLASGSDDNTIKVWNVSKDFELQLTIENQENKNITQVLFTVDNKFLISNSNNNICNIWSVQSNFEFVQKIQFHSQTITSMAVSYDKKFLATTSKDKTCKIWDIQSQFKLMKALQNHSDEVISCAFSDDGKYLATSSSDKTIIIWSVDNNFDQIQKISTESIVLKLFFNSDSTYLIANTDIMQIFVWKLEPDFKLINKFKCSDNKIVSFQLSKDSKYLLTSSDDQIPCKIWQAQQAFKILSLIPKNQSLFISENKQYILSQNPEQKEYYEIFNITNGCKQMGSYKEELFYQEFQNNFIKIDDIYKFLLDQEVFQHYYSLN